MGKTILGDGVYYSLTLSVRTSRESPQGHQSSPRPEPTQEVTSLLLLSIFAIAARFCDDEMPLPPKGKMWEAGCGYLDIARGLLGKSTSAFIALLADVGM